MSTRAHSQKQTHFPHNVNSHAHTAQHHKHAPCAVEEGVQQGREAGGLVQALHVGREGGDGGWRMPAASQREEAPRGRAEHGEGVE